MSTPPSPARPVTLMFVEAFSREQLRNQFLELLRSEQAEMLWHWWACNWLLQEPEPCLAQTNSVVALQLPTAREALSINLRSVGRVQILNQPRSVNWAEPRMIPRYVCVLEDNGVSSIGPEGDRLGEQRPDLPRKRMRSFPVGLSALCA